MKTITYTNPKGGVGKTTAGKLAAQFIAEAGGKVAILDLDPNKNIVAWATSRQNDGKKVPFTVFERPEHAESTVELIDQIEEQGFEYLIVDLEGTKDQVATLALSRTDLAVVPIDGSFMEARQAAEAIGLIKMTSRMIRSKIPFTVLFTRTNAAFQTADERDVRQDMKKNGIPTLPIRLAKRAPYTRIFRDSLLLSELPAIVAQETEGKANSTREKAEKQIYSAIANGREYSQAIIDSLEQGGEN